MNIAQAAQQVDTATTRPDLNTVIAIILNGLESGSLACNEIELSNLVEWIKVKIWLIEGNINCEVSHHE